MFAEYIKRLESHGWTGVENEGGFKFTKGKWVCVVDGPSNTVSFEVTCLHLNRYTNMASGSVFCRDCGEKI